MTPRRILAAMAIAMLAAGLIVTPAAAHPSSWYYTGSRWPVNASVSYGLNAGFPGGDYRSRVYDGKQNWNLYDQGNEPNIYWALNDDVSYGAWDNPCTLSSGNNTVIVFWVNLDSVGSGVAGYTRACSNNGVRTRVTIAFDSTRSWYAGTGGPASGYTDFWSVASHEWGHAEGQNPHFTEGEAGVCPTYENIVRNTMCPAVFSGYTVQRDLATHDIHTFQAAY